MSSADVRVVYPPHQLRADYVSYEKHEEVLDRFQRRLEPKNYNSENFRLLRDALEVALQNDPDNDRYKFALAFTILQRCASDKDVGMAHRLLSDVEAEHLFNPSDVRKLKTLVAGIYERSKLGASDSFLVRRANWSINNACPMVCRGCYNPFTDSQLTLEQAKRVVDKLAFHGTKYLVISGGDPLLWPDIYSLIDYAVAKSVDVSLDTTGVTLSAEGMSRLAGKLSSLRIPIDGSTTAVQKAFRRSGKLDLVSNFSRVLELCASHDFYRVRVHTVASKQNLGDLATLAALVLSFDVVEEWVLFQWWGRRAPASTEADMAVGVEQITTELDEIRARYPDKRIYLATSQERELVNFFIQSSGQVVTFASGHSEEFIVGDLTTEDMETIVGRPLLAKDALIQDWGWADG